MHIIPHSFFGGILNISDASLLEKKHNFRSAVAPRNSITCSSALGACGVWAAGLLMQLGND